MAPTWGKLADNIGDHVTIASINCQEANELCGKYQISGVPALKIFTKSEGDDKRVVLDYSGDRSLGDLISFAKRHATSYIYKVESNVKKALQKRHVNLETFLSKVFQSPPISLYNEYLGRKFAPRHLLQDLWDRLVTAIKDFIVDIF